MKHCLLGYYNYTVILTYIGMAIGFLGILLVVDGSFDSAVLCLMLAGICDIFDGTIASTRERNVNEKCFGIQIDSFSDLICFGVLPAMIFYKLSMGGTASYIIAVLYVLCALIRLAYFNVDEQNRQQVSQESRNIYRGLPVTAIALLLPLVYMACGSNVFRQSAGVMLILASSGVLFLMPFEIHKPKWVGKVALVLVGVLEFAVLVTGIGDV